MDRLRVALIGPWVHRPAPSRGAGLGAGRRARGDRLAEPRQGRDGRAPLRRPPVRRPRPDARHRAARRRLGVRDARRPRGARARAHRARDPPDGREAARGRRGDARADQRRPRRGRAHRRRRLPLARDGHPRRGRRRHREPPGQAAQRPLARQPAGRRVVARPRDERRPDGRAGDPPRRPLAPAVGGGDRGRRDRRPPPAPGVPGDGRPDVSTAIVRYDAGPVGDVHGDLHPRRDERPGDPPVRRRPRDHDPPAGRPVRGRAGRRPSRRPTGSPAAGCGA